MTIHPIDGSPRLTAFMEVMERMNYLSREWWAEALEKWGYAFLEAKTKLSALEKRAEAATDLEKWEQECKGDLAELWRASERLMEGADRHNQLLLVGHQLHRHYEEFKPLLEKLEAGK